MKNYSIRIETTVHTDDKSGREYLRFTPVVRPIICASGELRTASFDAWLDVPEEIAAQRQNAETNAIGALRHIFG